jgi:hypothetical protein
MRGWKSGVRMKEWDGDRVRTRMSMEMRVGIGVDMVVEEEQGIIKGQKDGEN